MNNAVRSRRARTIRPELTILEERTVPAVIADLAQPHEANSILVQFKSVTQATNFNAASVLRGVTMSGEVAPILVPGLRQITFDPSQYSISKVLTAFGNQPSVGYAEPNYTMFADVVPNDPSFGNLWGMNNTGQTIGGQAGTADADIDAPEAWDMTHGSGNFVIAVIDTGVDYNHPDLAANMWTNPGEIAGNGTDDDGNGFVDDVHGWDFVNNDNDPMDDHNHGTHCSGTIGGVGDNGVGVAGVNWDVQIMALKFLRASGSGPISAALGCLNYAVMMNVKVSSNSWGGGGFDNAFNTALNNARSKGHIFVAAAGNAGRDNDVTPNYPSNYPQDNVVAVAATDNRDAKAGFSSWGKTTVDLAAPGVNTLSTTRNNTYSFFSGTSMATPHVAGAVALVWDLHPNLTYSEVISRILGTVDVIPSMNGLVVTNGRLNLQKATFNTAPAGVADAYTTPQDTTLNIAAPGVLANDTDGDKDALTAVLNTQATNGTATVASDGSFQYVPQAGYFGPDSFTYVARDAKTSSAPITVNLTILRGNQAPVAVDDVYLVTPGRPLSIAAPGVLTNDTDADDPLSALSVVLVTNTTLGPLTLNPDGSFSYTPPRRMPTNDSFQYRVFDGKDYSNVATVFLRTSLGSPPVSQPDVYVAAQNTPLNGNVLTNDSDPDGDPLTAIKVTDPLNGALILNSDGTFTYTPANGYVGPDSFTYVANDGFYNGNTVKVAIRVDAVPVANPDSYATAPGIPLLITAPGVLANDTDADGDPLTATLGTGPTNGTITFNADGSFIYSPNAGYTGPDQFTYTASDGSYASTPATVSIAVGKPPQANPDSYTTSTLPLSIPAAKGVLINDSSPNSNPLAARLITGPATGTVTLNADGSFTYSAPVGFTGTVTYTYVANDGVFDSNVATVTITVQGAGGAPIANDNTYSTTMGRQLIVPTPGVLANDSDPDGDPLDAILNSGPSNGTLQFFPNGSFFYRPNLLFTGTDSFTYVASDGRNISNVATVTINVTSFPVPQPQPIPSRRVVEGQEVGGRFKVFSGETGQEFFGVTPYPNFNGSIRIAVADYTRDGVPDVVVGAGPQAGLGTGLRPRVYDGNTGQLVPGILGFGFTPFGDTYRGGIQVAAGDINGDTRPDLVFAADDQTVSPSVRVYDGATGTLMSGWLGGFTPYTGFPTGGVRIAVGDVTSDKRDDIITAPGSGASPLVRVFDSAAGTFGAAQIASFNAYSTPLSAGIYVAAGDLDGDGKAEIITGAELNPDGHVRVFSGTGTALRSLFVNAPTVGAVRVAAGDINGDSKLDLVVGAQTTGFGGTRARVYDATTLQEMLVNPGQFIYDGIYNDAVFVAALNKVS